MKLSKKRTLPNLEEQEEGTQPFPVQDSILPDDTMPTPQPDTALQGQTSNPTPNITPPSGRNSAGRKARELETEYLGSIAASAGKLLDAQERLLQTQTQSTPSSSVGDREKDSWADWLKCEVAKFNNPIWRKCQREVNTVLYKYIDEQDASK